MRASEIQLNVLLRRARRDRAASLERDPSLPRFRNSELNRAARLDAVIDWLERVPLCEWTAEYLEQTRRAERN